MGVGPTSWEEAGRAWSEVSSKHKSLMEWIQTGELFEHRDSSLNTLARSIRVPLEPNGNVLALTVAEQKTVQYHRCRFQTPLCPGNSGKRSRSNSFATVPLVAKDRVIGVILVDNMFNQRPITDRDIRFLTMFAHQAALAIENAIIHTNLETMNKDMRAHARATRPVRKDGRPRCHDGRNHPRDPEPARLHRWFHQTAREEASKQRREKVHRHHPERSHPPRRDHPRQPLLHQGGRPAVLRGGPQQCGTGDPYTL